jgi:hypothetical protein
MRHEGHGFWMFPLMMLFFFLGCGIIFHFARRSFGYGRHGWGGPVHTMNQH